MQLHLHQVHRYLNPRPLGFSCASSSCRVPGHCQAARGNRCGLLPRTLHALQEVLRALRTSSLVCAIMAGVMHRLQDCIHKNMFTSVYIYACACMCMYVFTPTHPRGRALPGLSSQLPEPANCPHCLWGTDPDLSTTLPLSLPEGNCGEEGLQDCGPTHAGLP